MARYSDTQGFVLPEDSDVFEVENVIAGNFEKADSALGLRFAPPMTAQEYAAMESRDSRTVYTVTGDGKFRLYLGELPMDPVPQWYGTQEEYDAIDSPDPDTDYNIVG